MVPGGSMPHTQVFSNNPNPEPNQPNSSYWYLFFKDPSHLRLGLPKDLFPVCVSINILKALLPIDFKAMFWTPMGMLDFKILLPFLVNHRRPISWQLDINTTTAWRTDILTRDELRWRCVYKQESPPRKSFKSVLNWTTVINQKR